jgi:hypothetical protein
MDVSNVKSALLKALQECNVVAADSATWIKHFFYCFSDGFWTTPTSDHGGQPFLEGPFGDGLLGVIDRFRKQRPIAYRDATTDDSVLRRLIIQVIASGRHETVAAFSLRSLTYHSLVFDVADDIVYRTWLACGGPDRFPEGLFSDWLYQVSLLELQTTVSRLVLSGYWGARPLITSTYLFNELDLEHVRGVSAILALPGPTDSRERTADNETDNAKKNSPKLPENPDVTELIRLYRVELPKGRTKTDIALELMENDEHRAQSLMRQARRFPDLLRP